MMTLEELNSLISTFYLSTELTEIKWDELSENDKQVLLNKAIDFINELQFDGYKVSQDQQNEFPRIICREVVQTPYEVKKAICRLVFEFRNNTVSLRRQLQREGVASIDTGTGGTKETYALGSGYKEVSNEFKKILSNWLYRGV